MDQIITITDKALEQIRTISQNENPNGNKGLRLAVTGGGCSGLSYKIEFSEFSTHIKPNFSIKGLSVVNKKD